MQAGFVAQVSPELCRTDWPQIQGLPDPDIGMLRSQRMCIFTRIVKLFIVHTQITTMFYIKFKFSMHLPQCAMLLHWICWLMLKLITLESSLSPFSPFPPIPFIAKSQWLAFPSPGLLVFTPSIVDYFEANKNKISCEFLLLLTWINSKISITYFPSFNFFMLSIFIENHYYGCFKKTKNKEC